MTGTYFLVDADYTVIDNLPVIRLFCVDEKLERRIFYDRNFKPYCYVDAGKEEFKKTIVMVTHDPHAAERAHKIQHLDKGVLSTN